MVEIFSGYAADLGRGGEVYRGARAFCDGGACHVESGVQQFGVYHARMQAVGG